VTEAGDFKEDTAYTAQDIRFTTKADVLYAITLGVPTEEIRIKSLGRASTLVNKPVAEVTLLGSSEKLNWKQEADALVIQPAAQWPSQSAVAFVVKFARQPQ
jgi:alpha-L-fucosidase